MAEVEELFVVLHGKVGGFMSSMAKAEGAANGFDGAMKRSLTGLAALSTAATLAAVGVAVASVKMAMGFQSSMERVRTQAGASQAEVNSMSKAILSLAGPVAQSPQKLAEGLYHIESAGFRGAVALDMLKASAMGATIGNANLEDVTQAMIGTMAVGFKDVRTAADAMAYLNTIVGVGDMKMGKLAASIATGALPSFKSAGLGMVDFGASLATLTDNVTPADEAATRLRMTISLMAAPTGKATKALATIGLTGTSLAEDMRKPNGLLVAVMDLKTHLEKSGKTAVEQNQVIAHAFGGGRTSGAILTLIEESDRLKSKYVALGNEAQRQKQFQQAWADTQRTFAFEMQQLKAAVEVLAIKLGTALLPVIEDAIRLGKEAIGWLKQHQDVAKALAAGGLAVLTAGFLALGVAVVAATWPFIAVGVAIAAVVTGIVYAYEHFRTFRAALQAMFAGITETARVFTDRFLGMIITLIKGMEPFAAASDAIFGTHFKKSLKGAVDALEHTRENMNTSLEKQANDAKARAEAIAINIKQPLVDRVAAYTQIAEKYHTTLNTVLDAAGLSAAEKSLVIPKNIVLGLNTGLPGILSTSKNLAGLPGRAFRDSEPEAYAAAQRLGSSLGSGLVAGIEAYNARAAAAADALGQLAIRAMNTHIMMSSPSKATTKLGHAMGDGLILGMMQRHDQVKAVAADMGRMAVAATAGDLARMATVSARSSLAMTVNTPTGGSVSTPGAGVGARPPMGGTGDVVAAIETNGLLRDILATLRAQPMEQQRLARTR